LTSWKYKRAKLSERFASLKNDRFTVLTKRDDINFCLNYVPRAFSTPRCNERKQTRAGVVVSFMNTLRRVEQYLTRKGGGGEACKLYVRIFFSFSYIMHFHLYINYKKRFFSFRFPSETYRGFTITTTRLFCRFLFFCRVFGRFESIIF